MFEQARAIANETFPRHLGMEIVALEADRVVVRLPYGEYLGTERIHGGAISSLVDLASTCAFWSHPDANADTRGTTVGFTINFLRFAIATDLTATATVRRRGGTLCTGDVSVTDADGDEVAMAVVTYKLDL